MTFLHRKNETKKSLSGQGFPFGVLVRVEAEYDLNSQHIVSIDGARFSFFKGQGFPFCKKTIFLFFIIL
jgi:hypothetical protein